MNKSKIKKIIIPLIILIVLIFAIYISFCIYFNILSKNIMLSSVENQGVLPKKYENIISQENYQRLTIPPPKNGFPEDFYKVDSTFTKFLFDKAETTCKYSYHQNVHLDNSIVIDNVSHSRLIIYYKFKNGKWVVDDLYFHN